LVELLAKITAADTKINEYNAAKANLAELKAGRDNAILALLAALKVEATAVQLQTGGIAEQILSTGYKVKAEPSPVAPPAQVQNLKLVAGAEEGTLKASWKRVHSAKSYEIQSSADPITPTSWVDQGDSSKTQVLLNSFTSGQRIWVHVRAFGAGGYGAWSDPSVKTVP
jgi:hypothetical protein